MERIKNWKQCKKTFDKKEDLIDNIDIKNAREKALSKIQRRTIKNVHIQQNYSKSTITKKD